MERCHHISLFFSDLRCFLPLSPSSSSFRRAPRASNLRSRERGKRKKRRRSVSESAAGASVFLSCPAVLTRRQSSKVPTTKTTTYRKERKKKVSSVCAISPPPPSTTFSLTFSVFEGERKGWEWGKKKEKDYLIPRCLRLPPFRSLLGWRKQKK